MKIKVKGNIEALKNPLVQWEITRQMLGQAGKEKKIDLGNVQGSIVLGEGETVTEALNLIKANLNKGFKGEVAVVKEVAQAMKKVFIDQMTSLEKDLNALFPQPLKKSDGYPKEWFKPPLNVAKQAEKGLELRRQYKRGGLSTREAGRLGIGSGVQRAVDLKQRENLDPSTIKRMIAFFARHEKHKDGVNKKGEPSAGKIAWLLWGGDEGRAWAKRVKAKMDRYDKGN